MGLLTSLMQDLYFWGVNMSSKIRCGILQNFRTGCKTYHYSYYPCCQNWHTHQMDISNAFLNGNLYETMNMKLPKGYSGIGSIISVNMELPDVQPNLVCRLKKSLYRLLQAPHLWFKKLSTTLLNMEYQQSKTDYNLFSKNTSSSITLILVYVDDLLLCGNCMTSINAFKSILA